MILEKKKMEIVLGDLKLWRKGNIIVLLTVISFCIGVIYLLNYFHVAYDWLNTLILAAGLIVFGMIESSRLFQRKYLTNCEIEKDLIKIKNDKAEWVIDKKDIRSISHREIRYGGKWLEPIGYRMILKTEDETYYWDSVFKEGEKWENTELFLFYQYLAQYIDFSGKE